MRPPGPLVSLTLVVLGGAVGGLGRHGLDVLYPVTAFPWSTFTINVLGSALLAGLPAIPAVDRRPALPLFLGTGALGGFTTLSAFSEETRVLLHSGRTLLAATYVVTSVAFALAAVLVVRRFATPVEREIFREEGGDE